MSGTAPANRVPCDHCQSRNRRSKHTNGTPPNPPLRRGGGTDCQTAVGGDEESLGTRSGGAKRSFESGVPKRELGNEREQVRNLLHEANAPAPPGRTER